jgi:hypothetical protein
MAIAAIAAAELGGREPIVAIGLVRSDAGRPANAIVRGKRPFAHSETEAVAGDMLVG